MTLNRLSTPERQRLAIGGVAAARGQAFAADARRTTNALRRLQAQADGSEASLLTTLQVRWATALRRATSSGDIAPLERALAVLQVDSANKLRTIEFGERQATDSAPLETIGLAAMALLVAGEPAVAAATRPCQPETARANGTDATGGSRSSRRRLTPTASRSSETTGHSMPISSATLKHRARTGAHFTLMAVDLDGLKRINDTKGHPAGDASYQGSHACA